MDAFYQNRRQYTRIEHTNAFLPVDELMRPDIMYAVPLDPPIHHGRVDGEECFDGQGNKYVYDMTMGGWITHGIDSPAKAPGCQHVWKEYIGFTDRYEYCTLCAVKR